jgi:hypothetical protein
VKGTGVWLRTRYHDIATLFCFQGSVAPSGYWAGKTRTFRLGVVGFGVKRSGWSGGMREARGDVDCFFALLSVFLLAFLSFMRPP